MVKLDQCKECDCGKKRIIVNKHFYLCETKNKIRLQVQKVQVSRSSGGGVIEEGGRIGTRQPKFKSIQRVRKDKRDSDNRFGVNRNTNIIGFKRSNGKIKRTGSKPTYRCSNGERVTQVEIDKRYEQVRREIENERERFCEATGRTDLPLSNSHTISQRRCKNLGKTELIWDKDNIFLESMGASDSGHYIYEHAPLAEKKKLINFEKKLEYIKKHDHELYQKFI